MPRWRWSFPMGTASSVAVEAVTAAAAEGADMLVRAETFGASRSDPSALVALAFVVQEIGIGVTASAVWSGIVASARLVLGRLSNTSRGGADQSFRISITVVDAKGSAVVEAEATAQMLPSAGSRACGMLW